MRVRGSRVSCPSLTTVGGYIKGVKPGSDIRRHQLAGLGSTVSTGKVVTV